MSKSQEREERKDKVPTESNVPESSESESQGRKEGEETQSEAPTKLTTPEPAIDEKQRLKEKREEARRRITSPCLIAADVDKTIVAQDEGAKRPFLTSIAPKLIESASMGVKLAFVTGNSMHRLCEGLLNSLIKMMQLGGNLGLLHQFHFFCNSGGTYAHFPVTEDNWKEFAEDDDSLNVGPIIDKWVVYDDQEKKYSIRPCFVDGSYIKDNEIVASDATRIQSILEKVGKEYLADLRANLDTYKEDYDLGEQYLVEGEPKSPTVEVRVVKYELDNNEFSAIVQITLKPIVSDRYIREDKGEKLRGNDLRTRLVKQIQDELDEAGLERYAAAAGGRTSIDVTRERLDKAYALEFLIKRLNLEGQKRLGQERGSNVIYLGDEVRVGGGNDYPVTRIPGVLVFAVNSDRSKVPFRRQIVVPSSDLVGPEATAEVLARLNICASKLLAQFLDLPSDAKWPTGKTALGVFKEEFLSGRINDKLTKLNFQSDEDLQTVHALATLMARDDRTSHGWLDFLARQLDATMQQLETHSTPIPTALGDSSGST